MRRALLAWLLLLTGLNVWRLGEAISWRRTLPDVGVPAAPVLSAVFGAAGMVAFGAAWLGVLRRTPWARGVALGASVAAAVLDVTLRAALGVSSEARATLGFHAILGALMVLISWGLVWRGNQRAR